MVCHAAVLRAVAAVTMVAMGTLAVAAARMPGLHAPAFDGELGSILPPGSFTHFAVVTSWEDHNATVAMYAALFGLPPPKVAVAGGLAANGTNYKGERERGHTKMSWLHFSKDAALEIVSPEPGYTNWLAYQMERTSNPAPNHFGFMLPNEQPLYETLKRLEAAGYGNIVAYAHWGWALDGPFAGCWGYLNSTGTLGWTIEVMTEKSGCYSLPEAPPA